jgi:hypothetical protein
MQSIQKSLHDGPERPSESEGGISMAKKNLNVSKAGFKRQKGVQTAPVKGGFKSK